MSWWKAPTTSTLFTTLASLAGSMKTKGATPGIPKTPHVLSLFFGAGERGDVGYYRGSYEHQGGPCVCHGLKRLCDEGRAGMSQWCQQSRAGHPKS